MIYPNIHILTQDKNIYFSDFGNKSIQRNTSRYSYLNLNLEDNTAIIVVSQLCKNYKKVINFIKENKISNIYFFIDDIFRSSLENSFNRLSQDFEEIQKIKFIINKTKIKNYKIFHCEVVTEKIHGLDLEYADLFLNDFIAPNKERVKIKKKKSITYKVSCLNNRSDIHRQAISLLLCKKDATFLTINCHLPGNQFLNNRSFNIKNLDAPVSDLIHKNIKYLEKNFLNYLDPSIKKKGYLKSNIQHNDFAYNAIQQSFLNIITETCYTSNYVNISEKTIKPIICKRPFLMLGPPHSLQHLRELGFKTFNNWWDESYDLETDCAKRLQMVYYIADEILNKSFDELHKILSEMNEVLEYNYQHLNNMPEKLLPVFNQF